MAENHELFDLVALYLLKRAYEPFPVPAKVLRSEIIAEIKPDGGEPLSALMSYVPRFLERNGYVHMFGQVTPHSDGTPSSGWRISLNDKGLVALKKPSLAQPGVSVYERIRSAFAGGAVTIGQDTASGLMTDVLGGFLGT